MINFELNFVYRVRKGFIFLHMNVKFFQNTIVMVVLYFVLDVVVGIIRYKT